MRHDTHLSEIKMNTNGRNPLGEVNRAKQGMSAALVGVAALMFAAFLCGGLAMILIGQPVLGNMIAACLAR